jgi:hypothetical protein
MEKAEVKEHEYGSQNSFSQDKVNISLSSDSITGINPDQNKYL